MVSPNCSGLLPTGSLSGWAPGNLPRMLPDGTSRLLRKGERLVLETHYHKTGRVEKDEGAQVALYFAKQPVKQQLHVFTLINENVNIPPGAEDHKMSALWVVPAPLRAFDVMPHMHLIGRSISVVAKFPVVERSGPVAHCARSQLRPAALAESRIGIVLCRARGADTLV